MSRTSATYIGEYHDASRCTFDGRACWVASICDGRGRFLYGAENVEEFNTDTEARAWLIATFRERGIKSDRYTLIRNKERV